MLFLEFHPSLQFMPYFLQHNVAALLNYMNFSPMCSGLPPLCFNLLPLPVLHTSLFSTVHSSLIFSTPLLSLPYASLPTTMFTSPSTRWAALQTRDPLAHTTFVYAVLSTHIYCRPDCISRLARRSNVVFYDTAAEAAAAGYRACKRCKPEMPEFQPQADAVRRACEIIESEARGGREIGLQELASRIGVTKCHLHRVFRGRMGVTPREWGIRCSVNGRREIRVGAKEEGVGEQGMVLSGEPSTSALCPEADTSLATRSTSPVSHPEPETPFDLENSTLTIQNAADSWATLFPPSDLDTLDLDVLATPALLADLGVIPQHTPTSRALQQDVLFAIRLCSVGYLLVAFHAVRVCVLKMAGTEDELLLELFAKCSELGCGYLDLGADELGDGFSRVDEQSKAAMLQYVDGVVESLEKPLRVLDKSGSADVGT